MKLTIALQFITIAVAAFLLFEANKALDSQLRYLKQEAYSAYFFSCTANTTTKTIIECGMEASDYVEEFVK
jgi:hypothetical protein